jgi:hypothetical protein
VDRRDALRDGTDVAPVSQGWFAAHPYSCQADPRTLVVAVTAENAEGPLGTGIRR